MVLFHICAKNKVGSSRAYQKVLVGQGTPLLPSDVLSSKSAWNIRSQCAGNVVITLCCAIASCEVVELGQSPQTWKVTFAGEVHAPINWGGEGMYSWLWKTPHGRSRWA